MALTDEEIERRVADALSRSLDASGISVRVRDRYVTLAGIVPSCPARQMAGRIAAAGEEVEGVDNRLAVVYDPAVPIPDDAEIARRILNRIAEDPNLNADAIRIAVDRGAAILEGDLDAPWKRDLAEDHACQVRGVVSIRNRLDVVPTGAAADAVIAQDVRTVVDRLSPSADVIVRVENRVVTLEGSVPDREALHAILEAASLNPNVVGVIDSTLPPAET